MSLKTSNFRFGDFVLDGNERILTKSGTPVTLPPKALKLLFVLVENRGCIVDKDDLMERVWADTFVEVGNLAYTIRLLRKTLDDDAVTPKFIETVPRRGYRFVAECQVSDTIGRNDQVIDSGDCGSDHDGPLIGRVKEIADLVELLAGETDRLVTLTGTGGTGKTRLAKEVARQIKHRFQDGVFFVELAAVTDPSLVATTIAHGRGRA